MANDRKPWDQLDGESDVAYARFLIYRNLGPARSLDAAYRLATPIASNRVKSRGGKKTGSKAKASVPKPQTDVEARLSALEARVTDLEKNLEQAYSMLAILTAWKAEIAKVSQ